MIPMQVHTHTHTLSLSHTHTHTVTHSLTHSHTHTPYLPSAEMFQKLSKVLLVLTDPLARASYDRWQRAKRAARRRHEELGVKRKKLKEKLEQRESQQTAMSDVMSEREAAATMQKEVRTCGNGVCICECVCVCVCV